MDDFDLLDQVINRLHRVRYAVGSRVFQEAARGALVAIGRAVLIDAEQRSLPSSRAPSNVVRFPIERRTKLGSVD
jgi:hypothetical protein